MNPSNLPPGCTSADGLSPEAHAWETFIEEISESGISAEEARARWDSQPDLLAACERLLNGMQEDPATGQWEVDPEAIDTVRAEIRKARGAG